MDVSGSVDLRGLGVVLWRRRWLVALGALAGGLAGLLIASASPRGYWSEGLLVANPSGGPAAASERLTEEDVLRSRALLVAVVDRLDLADAPDLVPRTWRPGITRPLTVAFGWVRHLAGPSAGETPASVRRAAKARALAELEARLSVSGTDDSAVLAVDLVAGSPTLAAAVVNGVMTEFIDRDLEARRGAVLQARGWLVDQVASARRDAEAAELAAQRFRAKHDLLTLEAGSTATLQLSVEQADLASAKQALARAEAVSAMNGPRQGGRSGASSSQQMLASPVIDALRERETDVLQRISEASPLGPLNPKRLALDEELRAVRAEIDQEGRKVALSTGEGVSVAQDQVRALQRLVEQDQSSANGSGDAELQMAQLTSDAAAKRATYQDLVARLRDLDFSATRLVPGRIVSAAVPALEPEGSRAGLMLLLGAACGTLLAASALLLRQLFAGRIQSAEDLAALTGVPDIGSLPNFPFRRRRPISEIVLGNGDPALMETLRGVRFSLQRFRRDGAVVVLVTSAESGEGKSTVAASLALRAAGDGLRVLLIEADLHRPTLGRVLGLDPAPALEEVLLRRGALNSLCQVDPRSGLHCLLARGIFGNESQLLGSDGFDTLVDRGRAEFDLVVIDSPPTLRVSDAQLVAGLSDVVLFAVKAEHTTQAAVLEGLRRVSEAAPSIVTLLTHARVNRRASRGYWVGYGLRPAGELLALPAPARPDATTEVEAEAVP